MLTSLVVAATLVGLAPEACSDRADRVATFSVAGPDRELLEVFTTEAPALACMRMGACAWGWTPTPAELSEIEALSRSIGSDDSSCSVHAVGSAGEPKYEGQRIAACEEQSPKVQGLMFGRQFVEALHLASCDPVSVDAGGMGEVRAVANVVTAGERFCLSMHWVPSASAAQVAIVTTCDRAPTATGSEVSALASDETRTTSWRFDQAPEGWKFTDASGTPPYAEAWAQSVGRALNEPLRVPPRDPLGYQAQTDAVLPYLLSRWSLAFAAEDGSSFDTTMREWMGRVELMNPTSAGGTLYRRECANELTPRLESCPP